MKTQGEDSYVQAMGRSLRRTNPVYTLNLDFQPSELWANEFLSFKPPTGWYFVMAPVAKQYSSSCVNGCLPQSLGLGLTVPQPHPGQSSQPPPRGWCLNSTYDCSLVVCIHFSEASSQDPWLLDPLLRCCCGPCLPVILLLGKLTFFHSLCFE